MRHRKDPGGGYGRGVLLDVARHHDVPALPDGYAITGADLDATATAAGVAVGRGDFVIVRTGQMEAKLAAGSWDGYPGGDAPGLGFDTLEWIWEHQIAAIATDTWGCEVRPNQSEPGINQPWHWISIPIMGLTVGEIFYLAELADDCAADGVCEFLFVAPALPVAGGRRFPGQPAGHQVNGEGAGGAQKMSGAQALALMLEGYGVTHFFIVPAILRQTMVELERHTSIRRIHAHGEKAAAYMADGYARVSRRPGVCGAQVIGALNLAAGLRDAYLAHAPVIALTGGRDPATKFRMVYQEVDDVPAFDNVTKLNATVDAVEHIPDMLRQAFRAAVSGCPRGRCTCSSGVTKASSTRPRPQPRPVGRGSAASIPAYRVPPDDEAIRRALAALQSATPGPGGGRRGPCLRRGPGPGCPGRAAADPGGHLAQRQGLHFRPSSAEPGCGRQLLAGKRQPGCR